MLRCDKLYRCVTMTLTVQQISYCSSPSIGTLVKCGTFTNSQVRQALQICNNDVKQCNKFLNATVLALVQ